MRTLLLLILYSVLALNALTPDEARELALSKGLKAIPKNYQSLHLLVNDPQNTMNTLKIKLGEKLFFDKNLSLSRKISCSTCHDINKGGEDGIPTAIGHNSQENPSHLNSPTVLNTAFSKHLFWDGRSNSLRDQAKGPIQAHFEMASTPELVIERVKENQEYEQLFKNAFKEEDGQISFDTLTKAIEVYEKTLVTRSAYDDFLDGNNSAITTQAQKGMELFIDLGCKGCHFGYAIGGREIQQFPLREYNSIIDLTSVYNDETKKRYVTKIALNFKPTHPYPFENVGGFLGKDGNKKFRVPILRNITQTAPYFHNGVVKNLRDAIFLMGRYQIGVDLDKNQIDAIEAYFKTLEGDVVEYDLY